MNDQEKAQHVRDILRADFDGKTILYANTAAPARSSGFGGTELRNMKMLLKYPERYSIKKEPKVIWVNVFPVPARDMRDEFHLRTYDSDREAKAEASAWKNETALVIAHPIEIREE